MAMFGHQDRLAADDRGNGVLEDELLLVIVFQQYGIFIKRPDASRQFDAANQVNRDLAIYLCERCSKKYPECFVLSCFPFVISLLLLLVVQSTLLKAGRQTPICKFYSHTDFILPETGVTSHRASIVLRN